MAGPVYRYSWLSGLMFVLLGAAQVRRGIDVIDTFYKDVSEPLVMEFSRLPLRNSSIGLNGTPQQNQAGPYLMPYANARLNSRIAYELPAGNWHIEWTADLPEYMHTRFVLQSSAQLLF